VYDPRSTERFTDRFNIVPLNPFEGTLNKRKVFIRQS